MLEEEYKGWHISHDYQQQSENFDEVDYDVDDEVLECGLENPDVCESCQ